MYFCTNSSNEYAISASTSSGSIRRSTATSRLSSNAIPAAAIASLLISRNSEMSQHRSSSLRACSPSMYLTSGPPFQKETASDRGFWTVSVERGTGKRMHSVSQNSSISSELYRCMYFCTNSSNEYAISASTSSGSIRRSTATSTDGNLACLLCNASDRPAQGRLDGQELRASPVLVALHKDCIRAP